MPWVTPKARVEVKVECPACRTWHRLDREALPVEHRMKCPKCGKVELFINIQKACVDALVSVVTYEEAVGA